MKLQSFYYARTKSGNAQAIAEKIAREYKLKADQIPPAYQPEREAIVFLTFDSGKVDSKLRSFCRSLTPNKARNVALAVIGPNDEGLDELTALIETTGVNVLNNVYRVNVKTGLFSKGKISDEQLEGSLKWASDNIAFVENA